MSNESTEIVYIPKVLYIGDLGESRVVNDESEEAAARAEGYVDTLSEAAANAHQAPAA